MAVPPDLACIDDQLSRVPTDLKPFVSKKKERPALADISNHVVPQWSPQWRQLGMELGVDHHVMNIIEHDQPNDCRKCCHDILDDWLNRNPAASWEALILAIVRLPTCVNVDVANIQTVVKNRYIQNRHTPHDDWPPYYPKHYTPLTVIHHEGRCTESEVISGAKRLFTKGYSMNDLAVKNINDLFIPFEGATPYPYRILIEGAPGIGKTILSKEIASQWANHSILTSKQLLFLLFMRAPQIRRITNVKSLVSYFCETASSKVTDWLVQTDGQHLVIILDGYDEVSEDNHDSFINDIIDRKRLTKCGVVITSRPAASSHLHTIVDCRAEVLGFAEENRQQFIQEALQGQQDKIEELRSFLQFNQYLNTLCYIPLNMSILLSLAEDGINALPNTQTKLFEKFIIMTIVHFLKKDRMVCTTGVASLNDIPHPYDQIVKELSQFAFLALQKDQLVFTLAEVKAACPNFNPSNWYGLGLLKPARYFKPQDGCDHESFHFLHFSIQEYMAAYHIASLPRHKVIALLTNTFWRTRYFNTWIMYVGITGGKKFAFKHFLSGSRFMLSSQIMKASIISSKILSNKIKCLHLLHCLAEVNHKMLPSIENIFHNGIIDLSHQVLSPNDVNTLAILLLRSPGKTWEKLDVSHCNIDDKTCNAFCTVFYSQNVALQVKSFNISCNNLHWESVNRLCKVLRFWHTEELALSVNSLYDSVLMKTINTFSCKMKQHLQAHVVKTVTDGLLLVTYIEEQNRIIAMYAKEDFIKCSQFSNCKLNENDEYIINKLTEFVKKVTQYELASIVFTYIIPHAKNKFSSMLSRFQLIKLYGSNMHSMGAYLLSSISSVDYHYNITLPHKYVADFLASVICHDLRFRASYLEALPAVQSEVTRKTIGSLTTLMGLSISKIGISDKAAGDIAVIISCNVGIRTLYLQSNKLGTAGAIKIARALKDSLSLTEFDISNNSIGIEAASDIATALSHNVKLRKLYIQGNNFQTTGIIQIARPLQSISSLTELNISNNDVSCEAADDIATVLSHNTALQKLYLGGNHLGTAGTIKIARALQCTFSLTDFSVSNNNINCEAADDIAVILSNSAKLQKLYLENNKLETTGTITVMRALEGASSLTECDLSSNGISGEAVYYIATVLSQNVKLQKLYLHGNNFGPNGPTKIVNALGSRLSLTEFALSNNDISVETADDIAVFLSHNTQLQKLFLHQNNLGTISAIKIGKALQNASSLIEFVISDNNITSEAAYDIACIIAKNTDLQKLYINGNNFGTAGVIQIVRALQNNYSLTDLNISNNNIGEEAADDIAAVLQHSTNLQKLYLGGNRLETIGIMKITTGLQNTVSLTEFNFSCNNVCDAAADKIAAVIHHNNNLRKLYANGNNLRTLGAIKVARALCNASLIEFNISSNSIGNKAADDIAVTLSHSTKLRTFYMQSNDLGTVGAMKIVQALKETSSLIELSMSNNNIGSAAADDIATVLSYNKKLQKFYIRSNNIGTIGAIKIARALKDAMFLKEFDILGNNIDSEAADEIAAVLDHNIYLRKLHLGRNSLGSEGTSKIARALLSTSLLTDLSIENSKICSEAADDISAVLAHSTNLQNLYLQMNNLGTIGIVKIMTALKIIYNLSVLDISNNNICVKAADGIAAVLSCNTRLQKICLGGNNLETAGIIKIMQSLHNTVNLMEFDVSSNNLNSEAADFIAKVLRHNTKLEKLCLQDNNFKTEDAIKVARALQYTVSLTELDISSNNISGEAASDITAVLVHNIKLEKLYL
ncbi:protein NLRC5-like [Dysidea avara]|uniref:protein NLRC5-like n=1 Tax=Dysidea avara TaxID=196820 RepID=UPI0033186FB1